MPEFAVTKQKQKSLALRMAKLGIREEDIFEQFVKGSGKGGQKINKTSSCVILRHRLSGTTVKCQRERRLSVNRYLARRLLADRIEALMSRDRLKPGRVSLASAHVMGGCRAGTDPADSVTDHWGQVHGAPWLYVADASIFPRCSEVNPYITIMALADRIAEHIRGNASELLRGFLPYS